MLHTGSNNPAQTLLRNNDAYPVQAGTPSPQESPSTFFESLRLGGFSISSGCGGESVAILYRRLLAVSNPTFCPKSIANFPHAQKSTNNQQNIKSLYPNHVFELFPRGSPGPGNLLLEPLGAVGAQGAPGEGAGGARKKAGENTSKGFQAECLS